MGLAHAGTASTQARDQELDDARRREILTWAEWIGVAIAVSITAMLIVVWRAFHE